MQFIDAQVAPSDMCSTKSARVQLYPLCPLFVSAFLFILGRTLCGTFSGNVEVSFPRPRPPVRAPHDNATEERERLRYGQRQAVYFYGETSA